MKKSFQMFSKADYKHLLIGILLIALFLRVLWAIAVPVIPVSDSYAYDTFARMLVENGVYGWLPTHPSAFWPVGTSAMYAASYYLFGYTYTPIVVLNIFLSLGVVYVAMWLALNWFGEQQAIVTGLLLAFWPGQIYFVTIIASELVFTLLIIAVYAIWQLKKLDVYLRAVIIGMILGIACYVRPVAALVPLLIGFDHYIKDKQLMKAVSVTAISTILIVLCTLPWIARNVDLFGGPVFISTNGGTVLWMGNNPLATGKYMPMPKEAKQMANEMERDKFLGGIAKEYILDNPGKFIVRTLHKAVMLYKSETIGVVWNVKGITQKFGKSFVMIFKVLGQGYWLLMLFSAGVGIILLMRSSKGLFLFHPVFIVIFYFTVVYAVMLEQDRYHYSVVPFIAILAAVAITKLRFVQNRLSRVMR